MSISMNNLPNELLLKICSRLSINDFVHLSSTSRHFYQFGQNFREEIFNAKTRLVLSDRHTVLQNRLLKKCFDLCMEQSSEQATTDLPRENIAELTINLKGTNFEILNQFANITQLIVVKFDSCERLLRKRLIPVLSPFPRLRMFKFITYFGLHYRELYKILAEFNFADLTHLSSYRRKFDEKSLGFNDFELPVIQMFCRLNEFYVAGTIDDSDIFSNNHLNGYEFRRMVARGLVFYEDYQLAVRRVGFYFDNAQTCFKLVENAALSNFKDRITHLTLHSISNDYGTLTQEQLETISNTFSGVQNFFPKGLDDKIKQLKAN